jgi:hypothetical protein
MRADMSTWLPSFLLMGDVYKISLGEKGKRAKGVPKKQSLFQSDLVLILSYLVDRLTTLQVVDIVTYTNSHSCFFDLDPLLILPTKFTGFKPCQSFT